MIANKKKPNSVESLQLNKKRVISPVKSSSKIKQVDFAEFNIPKDKEYLLMLTINKECLKFYSGKHANVFSTAFVPRVVNNFSIYAVRDKPKRLRPFPLLRVLEKIRVTKGTESNTKPKKGSKIQVKEEPYSVQVESEKSKSESQEITEKSAEPFKEIFVSEAERYYYFPFHNQVILQDEFTSFKPGAEVLDTYLTLTIQPKDFNKQYLTEVIKEIKGALASSPCRKSDSLSLEMKLTTGNIGKLPSFRQIALYGPVCSGKRTVVRTAEKIMKLKQIINTEFYYLSEEYQSELLKLFGDQHKSWRDIVEEKSIQGLSVVFVVLVDKVDLSVFSQYFADIKNEWRFSIIYITSDRERLNELVNSIGCHVIELLPYSREERIKVASNLIPKFGSLEETVRRTAFEVFTEVKDDGTFALLEQFIGKLVALHEEIFESSGEKMPVNWVLQASKMFDDNFEVDKKQIAELKVVLAVIKELKRTKECSLLKMVRVAQETSNMEELRLSGILELLENLKKVSIQESDGLKTIILNE